MSHPFFPDEREEMGRVSPSNSNYELLIIRSNRPSNQIVYVSSTAPMDDMRDALVLETMLTTTLPASTLKILHNLLNQRMAALVPPTKSEAKEVEPPPITRKRRPKNEKPEPEESDEAY